MKNEQMEDAFLNTGPPEASHDAEAEQPDPLYFAGFVPNLQDVRLKRIIYIKLLYK
jgi:hypothetical protein